MNRGTLGGGGAGDEWNEKENPVGHCYLSHTFFFLKS